MELIRAYNIKVNKYSSHDYTASIINKGKSKRHLAVRLFTIAELRQWKQVVKAFEEQIKEL